MNSMIKLVDFRGDALYRGNVLRMPAKFPYEDYVDFMIFMTKAADRPHGLIVTSGYKAGLVLVYLPKECGYSEGGVSRDWIISNWDKWVYPDCNVKDVYLIEGYVGTPP
ncbi:hypothetical protein I6I07_06765 [Achromobacter deleyi]|uniref:Immunity protein 45 domain-containing protein n=1 Tax=Achromobacter deleyi TaxID=1353891 RepID=A0A7T4B635_9BURK|nr:hypothetical protein I6I07_06765 [Achromobacter deleyi]